MPPPKTASKPDQAGEQLRQELEALNQALHRGQSKPKSSAQPRYRNNHSISTTRRDSASGGRSLFSRPIAPKPSHDPRSKKIFKGSSRSPSIAHDRPKLWLSQSNDKKNLGSTKGRPEPPAQHQQPPQLQRQQENPQEKKNFWSWRPFRDISHMMVVTQQRFHVLFSLHVHSVQGLPALMNGLRLTVHWNHKEERLQTMPSRVLQGVAEFGETLQQRCTVNGTRNANNAIKYDAKLFTLSVVALDVDELELGKHHIDLSHLLPQDDANDDDAQNINKWSTNFELSAGMAKGSTLIVTFNCDLVQHEASEESDDMPPALRGSKQPSLLTNSLPNSPWIFPSDPMASPSYTEPGADAKHYHNIDHPSFDEEGAAIQNPTIENQDNGASLLSDEHNGLSTSFEFRPVLKYFPEESEQYEFTFPPTHPQDHKANPGENTLRHDSECSLPVEDEGVNVGFPFNMSRLTREEFMDRNKKPWTELQEAWDSQLKVSAARQGLYEETRFKNVLETDLDDELDLVAGEFLDMLDIGFSFGHSDSVGMPDSPPARLLKQVECDSLFGGEMDLRSNNAAVGGESKLMGRSEERFPGGSLSTPNVKELGQSWESEDGFQLASIMGAAESELQKAAQTMRSKSRAKVLEDEETQALLQEWGLSEKSFQSSPLKSMSSFGSLFPGSQSNALHPPSLGKGLGSVLNLMDGGSLRSMSPSHFPKNRTSGSLLVMQVSKPIVVPSPTGSSPVDMLRHLASFGAETLAKQAMEAMPLEDITGKTAEEVSAMGMSMTRGPDQMERLSFQHGKRHQNANFSGGQSGIDLYGYGSGKASAKMRSREKLADRPKNKGDHDYLSLEDLAPIAMQSIEALAIDGLKVQADMAEEEAPSYLDAAAWGILEDVKKGDKDIIDLSQGVAGMHFKILQTGGNFSSDVKHGGPLSMAITLEEWTKLDAGVSDDDANFKDKNSAILAAHNAHYGDWELGEENKRGHTRRKGNMGNTLMIAMLVQLRDPLQNFEPVGTPMMALIQAERVMVPSKPRVGRVVSMKGNSEADDEGKDIFVQKEEAPQFKLTGVHISGLNVGDDEAKVGKGGEVQKKGWGSQKHLQSGSRWLVAQGMGKASKHSVLMFKPAPPTQTKVKPGETLWSISARVHGSGHKWQDLAALNPHVRNPDVIFTNDTIRTR